MLSQALQLENGRPSSRPPLSRTAWFSDIRQAQKVALEEEDRLRSLFAEDPNSSELSDPHVSLINVTANPQAFKYQSLDPDEARIPQILTKFSPPRPEGQSSIANNFEERWQEFTKGCLNGLDWKNVCVAGGAVLACISAAQTTVAASDIDLFVVGVTTDNEANDVLRRVYSTLSRNIGSTMMIRTERAVTFVANFPYRHVQVILRLHKSPAEVLLGFDIDSCAVAYDGRNVWAAPRFQRALNKGYNLANPSRRSLTYEVRLRKYSTRGFSVLVPDLDKARVNVEPLRNGPNGLHGLQKLLSYEYQNSQNFPANTYPSFKFRGFVRNDRHLLGDTFNSERVEEYFAAAESDYCEVLIPYGPAWGTARILKMATKQDQAKIFSTTAPGGRHKHLFTHGTDISDLLEGRSSSFWCSECAKGAGSSTEQFVNGRLTWLAEKSVYQDVDNQFRRTLFTGSFNPVLDGAWDTGVYGSDLSGLSVASTSAPFRGQLTWMCEICNESFLSDTLLERHRRMSGHSRAAPITKSKLVSTTPSGPSFFSPAAQPEPSYSSSFAAPSYSPAVPTLQEIDRSAYSTAVSAPSAFPSPLKGTQSLAAFGPQPGAAFASDSFLAPTPTPAPVAAPISYPQPAAAVSFATSAPQARPFQPAQSLSDFQSRPSVPTLAPLEAHPNPRPFISNQPVAVPAWYHAFAAPPTTSNQLPSVTDVTSKALLLIGMLYRERRIDSEERGRLKDLALQNSRQFYSALEVFELDHDFDEFVDTVRRVLHL